jgi:hypothetical protein
MGVANSRSDDARHLRWLAADPGNLRHPPRSPGDQAGTMAAATVNTAKPTTMAAFHRRIPLCIVVKIRIKSLFD